MTPAQAKDLASSYLPLNPEKVSAKLNRLEKMASFYRAKAPESKDGGNAFNSYATSIEYAVTIIKMYQKLTIELNDITGGDL